MNGNAHLTDSLMQSDLFQNYERAYTEATGMPVTLRPVETWQLPLHGKRRENPFCAMMADKSRTCSACLQTQEQLARDAMSAPCTMTCAYGLSEFAVPVKLGTQNIGFMETVQAMRGVAFIVAVTVVAEVGDFSRFDNPRQLMAYLGLTPS